jgi:hypothetical protein
LGRGQQASSDLVFDPPMGVQSMRLNGLPAEELEQFGVEFEPRVIEQRDRLGLCNAEPQCWYCWLEPRWIDHRS